MPITLKIGYTPKVCIAPYLLNDGFGGPAPGIYLIKTNAAGGNKKLGYYHLNANYNATHLTLDSKIAAIGYINASNQTVWTFSSEGVNLGSWANAPGYTPYDNTDTSAGHVYIGELRSQNNYYLEAWSQINANSITPGLITNSPKIVDLGVLCTGQTSPFSAFKFETNSRLELKLNTQIGTIPFLTGDIVIEGVINIDGTGELLREATSATNYILKHESGGTDAANNGYTITNIYKNGEVINPQTTGDVYTAFSGGFHHIIVYVSGVNFSQPLINLTGKLQELIIY